MPHDQYIRHAHIVAVYDGDTVTADFDLGFGIHLARQKLRLLGIDTPELRGSEREDGLVARDALRDLILHQDVHVQTRKDRRGKYGRWLAVIFLETFEGATVNVNDWLVVNG